MTSPSSPSSRVQSSPERVLGLGLGFQRAAVVLSAVELGLFDLLACSGPLSLPEVVGRLGLSGRGARDFLDALVAQSLLTRDASDAYANSPDADAFLVHGRLGYIGGMLELMNAGGYAQWGRLTQALRTGTPQGVARDGNEFFSSTYLDPTELGRFASAMSSYSATTAPLVAEQFPWAGRASFCDVGCSQGLLATTLAEHHPHLRGTGFDLPALRPVFEEHVRGGQAADRLVFHPGDFLTDELPTADVLIFSHILHDWGLTTRRELLAKAHRALPPGGAVLVQECFIDDERRFGLPGMLSSLYMLLETTEGFDSTAADCEQWLTEAGFSSLTRRTLNRTESIVIGIKESAR